MKKSRLFYCFYLIFLVTFTIYISRKPYYGLDMMLYMGIILQMDGEHDVDTVHQTVYTEVEATVSSQEYEDITAGTDYRKALFADEAAFHEQIPFYTIKPLYILFNFLFYKAGADLVYATVLPSLLSYFAIGAFLLFWIGKMLPNYPWLTVWVCLAIITAEPLTDLGKSIAPDGLSTLLMLVGCFLFIEKKLLWGSLLFFVLAIFTRPDSIILISLILAIALVRKWDKKVSVRKIFLCLIVCFGAYYVPKVLLGGVSWSTLFYHAFVDRVLYPVSNPPSLSVGSYIAATAERAVDSTYTARTILLIMAFIVGVIFWNKIKSRCFAMETWTVNQAFTLALIIALIVRFLLFPAFLGRFLALFLILFCIMLIREVYQRYRRSTVSLQHG